MGWNKFHAKKTTHAGRSFDSKSEAHCFDYLKLLESNGEIKGLENQVTVHLVAGINYRADFKFFDCNTGEVTWGEYKGFETPEWRIKVKLWKVFGPGTLRVFRGRHPNYSVEDVLPQPLSCQKCLSKLNPQH